MEFLISIFALLISIYTLIVATGLRRRIRKLDGESLYRSSQIREASEHLEQRISILGRFVAMASQGRRLTEQQILEDRLFDDIDASGARELIARNEALAVDVREPHEYASGHIPAARLVPVSQLEERWQEVPRDRTVIVYCASGSRSRSACRFLSQEKGYTSLLNLEGGIGSWSGETEKGMGQPRQSVQTAGPASTTSRPTPDP